MLDHRVRMHQVEAAVAELPEIAGVARKARIARIRHRDVNQIDHRDVDGAVAPERLEMLPVGRPAADIENPAGSACGHDLVDDRQQSLQAPLPEFIGIAGGLTLGGRACGIVIVIAHHRSMIAVPPSYRVRAL